MRDGWGSAARDAAGSAVVMEVTTAPGRRAPAGPVRRLARLLRGRRGLQLGLLLAGPVGWLVIAYFGALVVLLAAAFWQLDEFGNLLKQFGVSNFQQLVQERVYRSITLRTVTIAAAVTLTT